MLLKSCLPIIFGIKASTRANILNIIKPTRAFAFDLEHLSNVRLLLCFALHKQRQSKAN